MGYRTQVQIGDTFGQLTVVEELPHRKRGYRHFLCECSCGKNKVEVRSSHLTSGHTKSCGCLLAKDFEGFQFKTFTVVKKSKIKIRQRLGSWDVICRCGYETVLSTQQIQMFAKSRGNKAFRCPNCEAQDYVESCMFNYYKAQYVTGARLRGLSFELSDAQLKEIMVQNCHYCGEPPSKREVGSRLRHILICNGIDRLDNSKGYEFSNVVPCCKRCNYCKRDMSEEEYYRHCEKVVSSKQGLSRR